MNHNQAFRKYKSPTGSEIIGTFDKVPATAHIASIGDDGTPEYLGGSTIHWDDQKTEERDGKPLFIDESGQTWTFDQLTPMEDA